MKTYIALIFILISSISFSQKATEKIYTIKKEKIAIVKSFSEVVSDFPLNAIWMSLNVSANISGKPGAMIYSEKDFDLFKSTFLQKAKVNTIIYIDLKYKRTDGKISSVSYTVKVVE